MVHRIGAGGPIQRGGDTKWSTAFGSGGAIQREGDTKWCTELWVEGLFRGRETTWSTELAVEGLIRERGGHQVIHIIGAGGTIQREGDTKWSTELG